MQSVTTLIFQVALSWNLGLAELNVPSKVRKGAHFKPNIETLAKIINLNTLTELKL